MSTDEFFVECETQSKIKIRIASNFWQAWANILTLRRHANRVGYVDLYSGPGKYDDGTKCTCIEVLERAIAHPRLPSMLMTLLNDVNPDYFQRLTDLVGSLPGIDTLKFPPGILNEDVASGKFTDYFARIKTIPMFVFLDPWGIKGMTLDLIASLIKDWGSDCAFFFNFTFIRRALDNPRSQHHVDALFGHERANRLRAEIPRLDTRGQEVLILKELEGALGDLGYPFIHSFRFFDNDANLSHHLVYVCKIPLGYEIMKEIMAPESTGTDRHQGVPNYEYHPIDAIYEPLFHVSHPFDTLLDELPQVFAGRTLSMVDVYHDHNLGTPYIKANYKKALIQLENMRRITADPAAVNRRADTMADNVLLTFPELEQ